jgi:hypothetical protein
LPGAAIIEAVSIAHGCRAQRPNQRQNNVGLGLIALVFRYSGTVISQA